MSESRRLSSSPRGNGGAFAHAAIVGAMALAGCTGRIGDALPGPSALGGAGAGGGGTTTANAVVSMRRLANREYLHSVRDLLQSPDLPLPADLPPDSQVNGFDNNGQSSLSAAHVQSYMNNALQLATSVFADPTRAAAVVGCAPSSATCLSSFITSFGLRAFRRPLTSDEVAAFTSLAATAQGDPDPNAAISLVMQAMLQSPNFLDRPEVGVVDPTHPGAMKLTGYEIGTRLSYMLWATTPDSGLLSSAQAGALDSADGVEAAARKMLADPRAHQAIEDFYRAWLWLDRLGAATLETSLYPDWTPQLVSDAIQETSSLLDQQLLGAGSDVRDLVNARQTFLNGSLADQYGLPAPAADWQPVTLDASSARAGLLTQIAFLAGTAHADGPSVTRRGRFIRQQLLCQDLPPPPPAVKPILPPLTPGESVRQQFSAHESNASCAGCHSMMDPIGFGLMQFDADGKFATQDQFGNVIDVSGEVLGLSQPNFVGAQELADKIHDAPEFARCFAQQIFRFSLGRAGDANDDRALIDRLTSAYAATGHHLVDLIVALVRSDAFRYLPNPGGA